MLRHKFAQAGVEPNIVAEVDLEPLMLDLVVSGVGLALSRHSLALNASHAHGVSIADAVVVDAGLCFISRPEREGEPHIQAACAAIKSVWSVGG